MGLVDDYLSAYKVGKKEQMAARMAFFISGFAVASAHGVFYQRVCGCHMGANDTGS